MPEPRDPLLKVLTIFIGTQTVHLRQGSIGASAGTGPGAQCPPATGDSSGPAEATGYIKTRVGGWARVGPSLGNDPSAGSPTERLNLTQVS